MHQWISGRSAEKRAVGEEMKRGELVRIRKEFASVRTNVMGIWLDSCSTKWSEEYLFHRVLTADGVILDIPLKDGELEVIS